jgi:tetratricopeptide (TPR) repeat protein
MNSDLTPAQKLQPHLPSPPRLTQKPESFNNAFNSQNIDVFDAQPCALSSSRKNSHHYSYPKSNRRILNLDGDDNVFGNFCAVEKKIKEGLRAAKQGDFEAGLDLANKAIELADGHTSAFVLKAICLNELCRPREAIDSLNKYLDSEKSFYQVWSLKASLLEELGDAVERKICQEHMARTNPDLRVWNYF